MGFVSFEEHQSKKNEPLKKEEIKISKNRFKGDLNVFSGASGEFIVSIIPSMDVSGYGKSENEAIEDLKYNLNIFLEDLFKLSVSQRSIYLKDLGWDIDTFFKKKYSTIFIDNNGILQNFDKPEEVKISSLQFA